MSEIQKSLRIFGLEPGSSKDAVQRRYKRLIMVWHPDRFPTDEGKADAEEELKKINHAKDILFMHFDGDGHRPTGCECQSEASGGQSKTANKDSGTASGGGQGDAEAEARRRDQERRRRASEARDEYTNKQKESERKASSATQSDGISEAIKQEARLKDNALRWKIAIAEAIIFFGVIAFAGTGYGLKQWWHDVSWKWERDHAPQQEPAPTPAPSYQAPPATERDYSNNTAPPPNYNATPLLPNGVAKPFDNSNVPVPSYSAPSTNTSPNGFDWKMSPYETPSTSGRPLGGSTQTTTTTGGESALDYWSKIKTIPSGQQSPTTTTSTGVNEFDVSKYLNK